MHPRSESSLGIETESPTLAETLRRVNELDLHWSTMMMEQLQDGWVRVSDLQESAEEWINGVLGQIMAQYSAPNRNVATAFFTGWYAWYVATPAIACYVLGRQVPNLAPDAVALRLGYPGATQPMEIAFLDSQPVTHRPEKGQTLLDELRQQIENHLSLMLDWIVAATKVGRRGLWNHVADVCAEAFLHVGEDLGRLDELCSEGLALIQHPRSPMRFSKTSYLTLEVNDVCQTFRLRGSCCMYYKVPTATHCNTCPLLKGDQREQRLRQWMLQAR